MASKIERDERLSSFLRIFKNELQSRSDCSRPSVRRQIERLSKRAVYSHSLQDVTNPTLNKFLDTCREVEITNVHLNDDIRSYASSFIYRALANANSRNGIREDGYDVNTTYTLSHWKFGPGASSGVKGSHFYDKLGQLTVTSRAAPLARLLINLNPYLKSELGQRMKIVSGSKMSVVPKNEHIGRTICSEPSLNMAIQLSLGMQIEEGLKSIGVDISCQQDKNANLAISGSISNDTCTIDLRSASDLIQFDLLEQLWPASWIWWFKVSRSEQTHISNMKCDVNLPMVSTMGNGFTFPMMTLTILGLIYGVYSVYFSHLLSHNGNLDYNKVAVFGDDIICHSEVYDKVKTCLHESGLSVNEDKSYVRGPFRESCGTDAYSGDIITPFYVKALASNPEIYIAYNGLMSWCRRNNIFLPLTLNLLRSFIDGPVFLVPEWYQPYSGCYTSAVPDVITYYQYVPYTKNVRLYNEHHMLVILGSYNVPYCRSKHQDVITISPRDKQGEYKIRRSRLPKCFRDGLDYSKPTPNASYYDFIT